MSAAPDLDRLRWQKRIVLVFASDRSDQHLSEQRRLLESAAAQLKERDAQIFELVGDTPDTDRLRKELKIQKHPFAFVLVGKDGSVKLRRYEVVQPRDLFSLIDSMPMRQTEIKEKSSGTR